MIVPDAESAARVVYEYYGGAAGFPGIAEELMDAVDKADAAQFSLEEILDPPAGLLNFLMDPRTGLGRFRDFRISNYQLMMQLIDACTVSSIDEILAPPTSPSASSSTSSTPSQAAEQTLRCATVHGNLVVLDLRDEEVIHPTNRFMIYALFPQCNISIHVLWGCKQQNTVFATGKSILDRSSRHERRRADAGLRRRRPRGGRHLPGRQHPSTEVLGEQSGTRRGRARRGGRARRPGRAPQCPRAANRRAAGVDVRRLLAGLAVTCRVVWWIPGGPAGPLELRRRRCIVARRPAFVRG